MRSSNIASIVRGVPLALAKRRLAEIARIARQSRGVDSLCRHWPLSRFEFVEHAALALLESPPFNLSALAMDELQILRESFGDDMSRFSDVLEDVCNKPDWRIAYLAYFVPFGRAVLQDAAHWVQDCAMK